MTQPLPPDEKERRAEERQEQAEEQRRRSADRSWERNFLLALEQTGNVTRAAKLANTSRSTAYEHRELFADFADQWEEAADAYTADLLAEARRRAVDGTERKKFTRSGDPIIDATGKQYSEIEYSDALLMFLIKQRDPSFRETHRVEHANADNQPLEVTDPARNQAEIEMRQWQAEQEAKIAEFLAGPPPAAQT